MPIYRYYCPKCETEVEVVHSMADLDLSHDHECGTDMERRVTLCSFRCPMSNQRRVMNALNGDEGINLPANPQDRPRIEKAMAKGMDQYHKSIW